MKRAGSGCVAAIVALAMLAVSFVIPPSAAAYVWTGNQYYNIVYQNSTQYQYVTRVRNYLNEAFLSAYRVLGKQGWAKKITINFYQKAAAANGTIEYGNAPSGQNLINLNITALGSDSGAKIGSIIAHETSHILYCNYTRETSWIRSQAAYLYSYMLTESLARFTGDVAYAYGNRYSAAKIKSNLKYWVNQTGKVFSWYQTAANYVALSKLSKPMVQQTLWQFQAIGHFLTGGFTQYGNPYLLKTLYALKVYGSYPGSYLASSNGNTAAVYFENSFKYGYGMAANGAWQYGTYKNTNYLYGRFFYLWYV